MKVVTFNIHHGRGLDRRVRLSRIGSVLEALAPDVVALQEVDENQKRSGNIFQAEALAQQLRMQYSYTPALKDQEARYGNAILSRYPLNLIEVLPLPSTSKAQEPRNTQIVEIQHPREPLTFLNTHLGLRGKERRKQARFIADWIHRWRENNPRSPLILCGDLNEGPRLNGNLELLFSALTWSPTEVLPDAVRPTFPSFRPIRKLDYILSLEPLRVTRADPYRSGLSFAASDHLPFVAELEWQDEMSREQA